MPTRHRSAALAPIAALAAIIGPLSLAAAAAVFGIVPVIATISAVFGPALLITAVVVWKCD